MKKTLFFIIAFWFSIFSYSQNYEWAKGIGGYGNYEEITIDPLGNIYIVGEFSSTQDFDPGSGVANLTSNGGWDIFFAKYNSNGNYIWAKAIGASGGDEGVAIAVDASENVYVTGYFSGTVDFDPNAGAVNLSAVGIQDVFFAKYDLNGNYQWAKNVGSPGVASYGSGAAVDTTGSICFTGYFSGTADFDPGVGTANLTSVGSSDIFFTKYDMNGSYIWAKSMGSLNSDNGMDVYIDSVGNIYLTGWISDTTDFDPGIGIVKLKGSIFYAKYDNSGNYIWAKAIGSSCGGSCISYKIEVDNSGNAYIGGRLYSTIDFDPGPGIVNLTSVGSEDIFIAKYDVVGNYLWAKSMGSTGTEFAYSLSIDNVGNVYIAGAFQNTVDFDPGVGTDNLTASGFFDAFFAKYDNNGNYVWAKQIGSTGMDQGLDLTVDSKNNIFVMGIFAPPVDFDLGFCNDYLSSGSTFFAKYNQDSIQPVSICIITVDSTSTKNVIAWEKPVTTNIDSFRIYREISSVFTPIVTRHYDSLSIYTDTDASVNPNFSSYRYKISAIDTNGVESALSNPHETMWLQVSQPNPPMFDLTWTDYCGFPVTQYYIVRDSNNTNFWVRIDSVNFGTNVFIDSFPPTDSAAYRIEADIPVPCNVSIKNPLPAATTIKTTRSNSYKTTFLGVHENVLDKSVIVYPNPSNGKFNLSMSQFGDLKMKGIEIYNVYGEKVYSLSPSGGGSGGGLVINLSSQPNGIYFVKVSSDGGVAVKKIIINY